MFLLNVSLKVLFFWILLLTVLRQIYFNYLLLIYRSSFSYLLNINLLSSDLVKLFEETFLKVVRTIEFTATLSD